MPPHYHWLWGKLCQNLRKGVCLNKTQRFDCATTALMQVRDRLLLPICQCASPTGATAFPVEYRRNISEINVVRNGVHLHLSAQSALAQACSCGVQAPGSSFHMPRHCFPLSRSVFIWKTRASRALGATASHALCFFSIRDPHHCLAAGPNPLTLAWAPMTGGRGPKEGVS